MISHGTALNGDREPIPCTWLWSIGVWYPKAYHYKVTNKYNFPGSNLGSPFNHVPSKLPPHTPLSVPAPTTPRSKLKSMSTHDHVWDTQLMLLWQTNPSQTLRLHRRQRIHPSRTATPLQALHHMAVILIGQWMQFMVLRAQDPLRLRVRPLLFHTRLVSFSGSSVNLYVLIYFMQSPRLRDQGILNPLQLQPDSIYINTSVFLPVLLTLSHSQIRAPQMTKMMLPHHSVL